MFFDNSNNRWNELSYKEITFIENVLNQAIKDGEPEKLLQEGLISHPWEFIAKIEWITEELGLPVAFDQPGFRHKFIAYTYDNYLMIQDAIYDMI